MNLFRLKKAALAATNEFPKTVRVAPKTTNEIIEEIHETFYTEVDRLLAEARIGKSEESTKEDLIAKAQRLRSLGFGATKEVSEAFEEENRLRLVKQVNDEKASLVRAIQYFSHKYPHYKFITEQSVQRICEKYGLVYGAVSNYIGEVPEENLQHIEKFSIKEKDECYSLITRYYHRFEDEAGSYLSKSEAEVRERQKEAERKNWRDMGMWMQQSFSTEIIVKCPLEIAAPKKDFKITDRQEVRGFRIFDKPEIPDPVVLQPVFFEGKKHYLIVTAWGLEASDPIVVNEVMN